MHSNLSPIPVAPHDAYPQLGILPNGDRLLLNPDDNFVYQVEQARNIVISLFCSYELWLSTYHQATMEWK